MYQCCKASSAFQCDGMLGQTEGLRKSPQQPSIKRFFGLFVLIWGVAALMPKPCRDFVCPRFCPSPTFCCILVTEQSGRETRPSFIRHIIVHDPRNRGPSFSLAITWHLIAPTPSRNTLNNIILKETLFQYEPVALSNCRWFLGPSRSIRLSSPTVE